MRYRVCMQNSNWMNCLRIQNNGNVKPTDNTRNQHRCDNFYVASVILIIMYNVFFLLCFYFSMLIVGFVCHVNAARNLKHHSAEKSMALITITFFCNIHFYRSLFNLHCALLSRSVVSIRSYQLKCWIGFSMLERAEEKRAMLFGSWFT